MVGKYRTQMAEFAEMHALDVWYARLDLDTIAAQIKDPEVMKALRARVEIPFRVRVATRSDRSRNRRESRSDAPGARQRPRTRRGDRAVLAQIVPSRAPPVSP